MYTINKGEIMMEIKVCIGSACHLKGSYDVIKTLQAYISKHQLADEINLKSSFCLGKCAEDVSVQINQDEIISATPETIEGIMDRLLKRV
jgi:NADH:ubiquinone oxidoreductase subunit E